MELVSTKPAKPFALHDLNAERIRRVSTAITAPRRVTVIEGKSTTLFDMPPEAAQDPLTSAADALLAGAHDRSDRVHLVCGLLRELDLTATETRDVVAAAAGSYNNKDAQVRAVLDSAVHGLAVLVKG